MDAEVKTTVDKLGRTFEEFKVAYDQEIVEIKKNGVASGETKAQVAKIETTIDDLKTQMEAATKRADAIETEVNRAGMGGAPMMDMAARKAVAKFFSAVQQKRIEPTDKDLDIEAYARYVDAFEAAVRANLNMDMLSSDLRNAASVGSDPDSSLFVPAEQSTEIEKRIFDTSPMRQIARVIPIGKGAWEAPFRASKGISGGWVGEMGGRPATGTATGGVQRIPVHGQYAYPEITQDMLDDAVIDIADMIVEETSEEMSRTENVGFVNGNGVLKPRGFLDYGTDSVITADVTRSWGVLQYVASGAAGAWPVSGSADDPNALIDLIAALNPTYRQGALFTMNRTVEASVRKLKDADGRYLVGFGDLRDSVTGFNLLNFPVTNLEDMPDLAANSFSIGFGNWRRGYYIIDRLGFRVLRDPYTNKPFVGFYIESRVGGDVRNFDAIKLLKFSAS